MSSATGSASTSSTSDYLNPTNWVGNPNGGGSSQSTLYLFTFLIVLVILAVISAGLLLRAFYIKRRFRRRIQEAIANGQALPPDALAGLGMVRPSRNVKEEKKLGPMPVLWEAEMYKDEIEEDGSRRASMMSKDMARVTEKEVEWSDEADNDWKNLTPVGMIHYPSGDPKPPPPLIFEPVLPSMSETMPRRQLLRSLFRPDTSDPLEYIRQAEANRARALEAFAYNESRTTFEVPEQGSEVVVGVMIAFPTEEGTGSDKWSLNSGGEDAEQQVPDVCLGIMEARIGDKKQR